MNKTVNVYYENKNLEKSFSEERVVTGRLTADFGTVREVTGNSKVMSEVSIAVAINKDTTEFYRLVFWDKNIEFYKNFIKKGAICVVTGRYVKNEFMKDGQPKVTHEIHVNGFENINMKFGLDKKVTTGETGVAEEKAEEKAEENETVANNEASPTPATDVEFEDVEDEDDLESEIYF